MLDAIKEPEFYRKWFEALRQIIEFFYVATKRRKYLLLLCLSIAAVIKSYNSQDEVSKRITLIIGDENASTGKSQSLQDLEAWATQFNMYFTERKVAILHNIQDVTDAKAPSIEFQRKGLFLEVIVSSSDNKSLDVMIKKTRRELIDLSEEILPAGLYLKPLAIDDYPKTKIMPWAQYMGIAILAFLFLAVTSEVLQRNIVSDAATVRVRTGLPVIGMIASVKTDVKAITKDKDSPATSGINPPSQIAKDKVKVKLTHLENLSGIVEQYRFLRRNLQQSLKKHLADNNQGVSVNEQSLPMNVQGISVMIASAIFGEGRTTTAINTAISLAQLGSSVLLIDADMRRPVVHRVFKMNQTHGLSTFLSRQVEIDTLIVKLSIPNLSVLPCGSIPPNPAELIDSERMHDLIASLKQKYDFVILDSPPLLPVVDALALASKVDASIIVTQHGRTKLDALINATELLRNTDTQLLGIVMNNVDFR